MLPPLALRMLLALAPRMPPPLAPRMLPPSVAPSPATPPFRPAPPPTSAAPPLTRWAAMWSLLITPMPATRLTLVA
uniref:RE04035p n=1 Tax=Drosophila melanogaster TaxID=7227 RepID=F3YDP3_DROME|nr:RE04035p [Drosophila melanogaster]